MSTEANVPTDEFKSDGGRQPQDDANSMESTHSLLFILPYVEGVSEGFGEKMWQRILLMLHEIELEAEILLGQSTTAGKGGAKHVAPSVMLVVNKDGADLLALTRASQELVSIFSNQMAVRLSQQLVSGGDAGSQTAWTHGPVTAVVEDLIQGAIENFCYIYRSGMTTLNQAVWCRVGQTGAVERAVVDLSNEPDSIQFRAVKEKKTKKKRARRRNIPGGMPRRIQTWGRTRR